MAWLNLTQVKTDPAAVAQVVETLSLDTNLATIQAACGFVRLYLVESTDSPGDLVSITVWESAEDGQAYLASPECQRMVESVQDYLVKPLERSYYQVLIEANMSKESLRTS